MSRLQKIENALASINDTVFQELCDSFLIIRNNNYRAFSRVGTQSGKQKTRKGTPDTFLLLPNGKYVFIEYSTNVSKGLSKLKEDIEKCLDFEKTGINSEQIAEIIVCINFNLKVVQIEELRELLSNTRIILSIYTLDSLSLELHLHHRDLASQYLHIHLDTGQIISINQFVSEYNKASKGIATPLDNAFVHRESELKNLVDSLQTNDFIILTGPPGVGKTKLALEAITVFVNKHPTFNPYCISYKSHSLLEDLYQYFDNDKDYLLFVDDANRIDALSQITGFFRTTRKGKLKLILTVRDYAYHEVSHLCEDFLPKRIDLNKFSDEQITDIIKQPPFEILNPDYQKPIIQIADGNPRIAIMTTMLAKEKQDINALFDLTDLFERYFLTFVHDDGEFAKAINIKCLGIIAFFYTIPFKDKEVTSEIFSNFGISYNDFIDAIDRLEKLELVEIQYEYVKIPEQNLSTYFFYKAFIKDKLLLFSTLLDKYFDENNYRFRDSVIPANNTFGPERVMDTLLPDLKKHYENIKNDYDRTYKFLSIFWFYLKNETLSFLSKKIQENNYPDLANYIVEYEINAFSYKKNPIIELLGEFFNSNNESIKIAIELSIDYAKRNPKHLPEVIHKYVESLTFDREDEIYGFYRQNALIDILIDGLNKNDIVCAKIFFEVAKKLLKYRFNHFRGARNNSFYMYDYIVPNNKYTISFRKKIWDAVSNNYEQFSKEALSLLQDYSSVQLDVNKAIMKKDIAYISKIIEHKLNPEKFLDCQFVNNLIHWSKRCSIKNPLFKILAKKFTNPTYNFFVKIDWDRFKNREMFEFDDYEKYEKLKENEIRKSFRFKAKNELEDFYKKFVYLKDISKNDWNYLRSLEIILDENAKDSDIYYDIFKLIVENNNEINFYPRAFFFNHLKTAKTVDKLYSLINDNEFRGKSSWLFAFYDFLDENLVSQVYVDDLIKALKTEKEFNYIQFDKLEKFLSIMPNLFSEILKIVLDRNENENLSIQLWLDTFEKYFDHLKKNIVLLEKSYLQQEDIQNHFDYSGKSFIKILHADPNFLFEFIQAQYKDHDLKISSDTRNLCFVWEVKNIEKQLEQIFDFLLDKVYYFSSRDHFLNIFFRNIKLEYKERASDFLMNYCKKNYENNKAMEALVDISRHTMRDLYEPLILLYMRLTQDVDKFARISWRGNFTSASGDVILSDIEAADWRRILSIVEKSDLGIKILDIKLYINQRIDWCIERGNEERKRRFLSR